MSEEKEEFEITDDYAANWAFSKLAENKEDLDQIEKKKRGYLDQVDSWYSRQLNRIIGQREYMQDKLNEYRLTKPDGKIDTPSGKTIVKHPNKIQYDDDKLINFVRKNNPEMLTKVNKSELKKHYQIVDGKAIDDNGQIIDGIKFEQTESVSFKLNKGTE